MRRLVFALLVACHRPTTAASEIDATPSPVAVEAAPIVVDARPPPLDAPWIERLDMPENGVAYVTPPVGAREPRPIIVAVHGAWDDPGLMCSAWRLIVDVYAFVVCPGGRPAEPAKKDGRLFVWSSGDHIAKRAHEAIEATKAKYPGRVADGPMLYVAFSQGSNLAGTLVAREGRSFPRVVFTEGGYKTFDETATARAFAKSGGERVLFTCSQPGARARSRRRRSRWSTPVSRRVSITQAHTATRCLPRSATRFTRPCPGSWKDCRAGRGMRRHRSSKVIDERAAVASLASLWVMKIHGRASALSL